MKMMLKKGSIFLILGIFLFLVFSCGREKRDDDTIRITFYTMQLRPEFTDYINGIIAEFEEMHPGVEIDWMDVHFQGFQTRLMSLIRRGETPDVMNLNYDLAPALFDRGVLLPLDDYVTEEVRNAYFQNIMESACVLHGRLHSLPWYMANSISIFNMDLMRQAGIDEDDLPSTWTEMYELAPEFRERTGKFLFMIPFADKTSVRAIFAREGIELNEEDGKPVFNTPEAIELFETVIDVYKNRGIPRQSLLYEHRDEIELFQNRELGLYGGGPQFIRIIKENAPTLLEDVALRPGILGDSGTLHTAVHLISVGSQTEHPELSVEFAKFVTNAQNQLAFCKQVAILPSVKEAAEDPFFNQPLDELDDYEDKARVIAASQLPISALHIPQLEISDEINDIMLKAVHDAARGRKTPEEALMEAYESWMAVYEAWIQ